MCELACALMTILHLRYHLEPFKSRLIQISFDINVIALSGVFEFRVVVLISLPHLGAAASALRSYNDARTSPSSAVAPNGTLFVKSDIDEIYSIASDTY